MLRYFLAAFALALGLAGCATSRSAEPVPDDRFGDRSADPDDARRTMVISPADSAQTYFYYPAVFDSVHIRPAEFDPARPAAEQQVPVEVLIKGALPDACTALHDIEQRRTGHIVEVDLEMRRPSRAVCARVLRPYRFYLLLEGRYGVGAYTLKINDQVYAFEVQLPRGDAE